MIRVHKRGIYYRLVDSDTLRLVRLPDGNPVDCGGFTDRSKAEGHAAQLNKQACEKYRTVFGKAVPS